MAGTARIIRGRGIRTGKVGGEFPQFPEISHFRSAIFLKAELWVSEQAG